MTTFSCKKCDAPADLVDGEIVRTCECDAPVVAHLRAVASGEGAVN